MLNPLIKVARCFPKIRYRLVRPFLNILASICGYLGLASRERDLRAKSAEITKGHNEELTRAMVLPLLRNLDYQSLGRNLITIDELPQGAFVTYAAHGYVNRGDITYVTATGARTNVATETISTSPLIVFESGTGAEIINENTINSFTVRTSPFMDVSNMPYGRSFYISHLSPKDDGENALNDYLIWYAEQKLVREIEKRRKNVKSIIEIGD